ncbi:MAG: hypothetical protein IT183_11825 [Acidobacteria bacterium]|nr:hypothetical protein [Acidobacteriota bacterium]
MTPATLTSACLTLAIVAAPALSSAQSPAPTAATAPAAVTPADAKPFLGDWTIAGESQMGPFVVNLSIKDDAGKVAATISSEIQPPTAVADITKGSNGLVLRYSFDFDGNSIPAVLTVAMKADKLDALFSFADGAFEMGGVGTKAAPAAN